VRVEMRGTQRVVQRARGPAQLAKRGMELAVMTICCS
jgi:hypothetical protein